MKKLPGYLYREFCFAQRGDIKLFHGQTCLSDLFNLLLRTYRHHVRFAKKPRSGPATTHNAD